MQTELANANSVADEVLSSMTTVRAHAADDSAKAAYRAKLLKFYALQVGPAPFFLYSHQPKGIVHLGKGNWVGACPLCHELWFVTSGALCDICNVAIAFSHDIGTKMVQNTAKWVQR